MYVKVNHYIYIYDSMKITVKWLSAKRGVGLMNWAAFRIVAASLATNLGLLNGPVV